MKKFIKNYWWLIAIAVFLWWRKKNRKNSTSKQETSETKTIFTPENAKTFIGKKVKLHVQEPKSLNPGAKWINALIFNEQDSIEQSYIYDGEIIEISSVIVKSPKERNIGLSGGNPYTDYSYTIYLPDGKHTTFFDNWLSDFLWFTIVD